MFRLRTPQLSYAFSDRSNGIQRHKCPSTAAWYRWDLPIPYRLFSLWLIIPHHRQIAMLIALPPCHYSLLNAALRAGGRHCKGKKTVSGASRNGFFCYRTAQGGTRVRITYFAAQPVFSPPAPAGVPAPSPVWQPFSGRRQASGVPLPPAPGKSP